MQLIYGITYLKISKKNYKLIIPNWYQGVRAKGR